MRKTLLTPEIAILYPRDEKEKAVSALDTVLVYVINISEGGALFESSVKFEAGSLLDILIRLSEERIWTAFEGKVISVYPSSNKLNYHLLGVQFQKLKLHEEVAVRKKKMSPSDVEFLIKTELFDAVPEEARCPLLNCLVPKHLRAGDRLISQGDKGDAVYVIQHGTCLVSV